MTVTGAQLINIARRALGRPYEWGAAGPSSYDCSGLVEWTCRQAGINDCPRTSEQQFAWGEKISDSEAGPGDLAFFAGSDGTVSQPGHVGLVTSNGRMIDAPYTGTVVRYDTFSVNVHSGFGAFSGYRRIPKTQTSASANSSYEGVQNTSDAGGIVGAIMASVIFMGAVLFLVIALGALIAAAIFFN